MKSVLIAIGAIIYIIVVLIIGFLLAYARLYIIFYLPFKIWDYFSERKEKRRE